MFFEIFIANKIPTKWNFIANKIPIKIWTLFTLAVNYMLFEIFIANKIPIKIQHIEIFIVHTIRSKS